MNLTLYSVDISSMEETCGTICYPKNVLADFALAQSVSALT